ncbi:putative aquaporin [Diaporthe ampelina]|uniref:Putative aquaporin n=1 Tax=Diaporthe ampelina TaxID=1214573 RepID=A0A0G2F5I7_9PEZI|nr:putative aquaporin [Diaporthe ampelina]
MSSIPRAHIEMHRGGGDDVNPPLIVKQPVMLEPTELRAGGQRPNKAFAALSDAGRGHIVAMIGEYLGTTMFLFFGYIAAQTANEKQDITLRASIGAGGAPVGPSLLQISYISAVFGLSLAANVWIWYRVSGGMFNPSVAFGLWLSGAFNWVRLVCVIPAQFLGGITAAGLVSAILPGPLQAESSVSDGVSTGGGFLMEVFLTAELMITILMLAVEKSRTTFIAPLTIGIALTIIHLVGINVSGASVNPARSLGPAVVNNNYVSEFWIYFIGPTLGAAIAAGLRHLLKALAYQTANPGQDGDGIEFFRVVASSSQGSVYPSPAWRRKRRTSEDRELLLQDMVKQREVSHDFP